MVHRLDLDTYVTFESCDLVRGRTVLTLEAPEEEHGIVVLRLDRRGELDPTFGEDGVVRAGPPAGVILGDSVVLPDLSVRLLGYGGSSNDYHPAVHALRPDGSVDARYGNEGTAVIDELRSPSPRYPSGRDTGPDGQLYPAVFVTGPETGQVLFEVDRFGRLDPAFGDGGLLINAPLPGCSPPALDRHERLLSVCRDPDDSELQVVARLQS